MRIAKVFLAIGIAVVFALFIGYGTYVIYEPPKSYEMSNCSVRHDCEVQLRECWNKTEYGPNMPECENAVYQNDSYKKCMNDRDMCEQDFSKTIERYAHARNSFFILVALGIASLIIGMFMSRLEGIGSGIIGGGILIIIWSLIYTAEYWYTMSKYFKLGALGLVLAVLIYFGYKKLENKV